MHGKFLIKSSKIRVWKCERNNPQSFVFKSQMKMLIPKIWAFNLKLILVVMNLQNENMANAVSSQIAVWLWKCGGCFFFYCLFEENQTFCVIFVNFEHSNIYGEYLSAYILSSSCIQCFVKLLWYIWPSEWSSKHRIDICIVSICRMRPCCVLILKFIFS